MAFLASFLALSGAPETVAGGQRKRVHAKAGPLLLGQRLVYGVIVS